MKTLFLMLVLSTLSCAGEPLTDKEYYMISAQDYRTLCAKAAIGAKTTLTEQFANYKAIPLNKLAAYSNNQYGINITAIDSQEEYAKWLNTLSDEALRKEYKKEFSKNDEIEEIRAQVEVLKKKIIELSLEILKLRAGGK